MKEFIAENGGLLATILLAVVAFNFILMGVQKILEGIMKFTPKWTGDDKAFAFVGKVLVWSQKIIDWLGANREHNKPE